MTVVSLLKANGYETARFYLASLEKGVGELLKEKDKPKVKVELKPEDKPESKPENTPPTPTTPPPA